MRSKLLKLNLEFGFKFYFFLTVLHLKSYYLIDFHLQLDIILLGYVSKSTALKIFSTLKPGFPHGCGNFDRRRGEK